MSYTVALWVVRDPSAQLGPILSGAAQPRGIPTDDSEIAELQPFVSGAVLVAGSAAVLNARHLAAVRAGED